MTRLPGAYPLTEYTDDGVLKVPVTLWIAIVYLCRQPVIVLVVGISSFVASRRGVNFSGLDALSGDPLIMLASVPALCVLAAGLRRAPATGEWARWIWRRGRLLLALSILADLVVHYLEAPSRVVQVSLLDFAPAIVDLYLLVYLARSTRAADTFRGFPARSDN